MADPVFRGKVAPGCEGISYDSVQELINQKKHLQSIGVGQPVEVIIRKPRKHRSNNQNAYYWGVVIDILSKHFGYEPEEMHDALLYEFSKDSSKPISYEFEGERHIMHGVKRTSSMSTVEFEDYCARIRRWAVQNYGVRILEPNEVEV